MASSGSTCRDPTIYRDGLDPLPEDHIALTRHSASKPAAPAQPSYGLDSVAGLLYSNIAFPLYLYASLWGKHAVWDEFLSALPDEAFCGPALDVGCGRGLVLCKIANRKKTAAYSNRQASTTGIQPVYGMDIFSKQDQTGNDPLATYRNAAALGVLDYTVLHTASFTDVFPFRDGVFDLVTSSLAIHNVDKEGRKVALEEIARVCKPGGRVVLVDLYGYFREHIGTLKGLGWDDVRVSWAGVRMMYGMLPCQVLKATKPT